MRQLHVPTNGPPIKPGAILVEEFLTPMGITQSHFAKHIGVTFHRLNEIVNGKRGVSPDTALRLSKALGTSAEMWLNLQRVVDLYDAQHAPSAAAIGKIKLLRRKRVA